MKTNISIIIPVYNTDNHLLLDCINSILSQSSDCYEIILVDDGSNEDTASLCDYVARENLRIRVIHKSNGGVSSARNRGIREAKYEIITFVDSDDRVDSDYIDKLLQYKKYDYVISSIANTSNIFVDIEKELYGPRDLYQDIIDKEVRVNMIHRGPTAKLYKKSIIDKYNIHFNENISMGEDFLFNLEYISKIRTAYISNYSGYHYIENSSSLTHSFYSMSVRLNICNSFRLVLSDISNEFNMKELYDCLIANKLEGCLRYSYRFRDCYQNRKMALAYIKCIYKKEMNKYIKKPYNFFFEFINLPFLIFDLILSAVFIINHK